MLFKIVYVRQQKTKTPENMIQTRQYQRFPQLAALREILGFRTGRTQGETEDSPSVRVRADSPSRARQWKFTRQSAREKEPWTERNPEICVGFPWSTECICVTKLHKAQERSISAQHSHSIRNSPCFSQAIWKKKLIIHWAWVEHSEWSYLSNGDWLVLD